MQRLTSEKYILNVLDFFKIKHQGQVSTKLLNTLARELSVRTLPRNKAEAMNKLREAFITWRLVNRKTLQTRPPEKGTIKTEKVVPKITEEEKPRVRLNQEQGTINNPIDDFLDKLPLYTAPHQAKAIAERLERQRAKRDATAEKIKKVQAEAKEAEKAEKAEKAEAEADEPEPPKKKRGRPKKEPAPEPEDIPIPEL